MEKLNVLRIGNNKLSSREDILYLRRLRNLRTLSIKGNPLCTTGSMKAVGKFHIVVQGVTKNGITP